MCLFLLGCSFASSVSLSTWVGEGLICIVHSVSFSIWVEVGLICIIHNVTPFGWTTFQIKFLLFCLYLHCHCPQCVSLYFEWRKGRDSFTSSTGCHRLSGGEGGTHLHPPEVILCMIPPPPSIQGRGRHIVDANEPLPHLHPR